MQFRICASNVYKGTSEKEWISMRSRKHTATKRISNSSNDKERKRKGGYAGIYGIISGIEV